MANPTCMFPAGTLYCAAGLDGQPLPAVLDVDQVAQLLRCAATTVQEMARAGKLPGIKPGVDWIFPTATLLQHLDAMAREELASRRRTPAPNAVATGGIGEKPRRRPPALPSMGATGRGNPEGGAR
jgi:excisionase family DNA binding protein